MRISFRIVVLILNVKRVRFHVCQSDNQVMDLMLLTAAGGQQLETSSEEGSFPRLI